MSGTRVVGCCYHVFPLCELAESVGGRREVQEGKGEKGEVSTQSAVILFVPFIFLQSIRSKRLIVMSKMQDH